MKVGQYVYVRPGVWDDRMTDDRCGLVLEVLGRYSDQVLLLFSNSQILKFHKSQVESVKENIMRYALLSASC